MLIAIATLAVLATLVAAAFSSTFRIIESVGQDGGLDHTARVTLNLLTDDLVASHRDGPLPWTGRNGTFDGQPADLLAFGSSSQVRTLSTVPQADVVRVIYARDGAVLKRVTSRHLYATAPEYLEQTEIARGVSGFNLRYYDRTRQDWVDDWDGRSRNGPPAAVMIELTLDAPKQEPRTFRTWVTIPLEAA